MTRVVAPYCSMKLKLIALIPLLGTIMMPMAAFADTHTVTVGPDNNVYLGDMSVAENGNLTIDCTNQSDDPQPGDDWKIAIFDSNLSQSYFSGYCGEILGQIESIGVDEEYHLVFYNFGYLFNYDDAWDMSYEHLASTTAPWYGSVTAIEEHSSTRP